ncbi:alpha/beta fold hydrolase, partial [Thermodesulfobacteriota bacterium]
MKLLRRTILALALLYGLLIVIAHWPVETTPIEKLAGPDSRFITLNGTSLHYTKWGAGPPLVLVHGYGGSTYTWRELIPLLKDRHSVYALDLLGFGLTAKPPEGDYSMPAQAGLVIDFLKAMNLPQATLVGHSMGGIIVAYAAIQAPELVDRLVIVEGGFYHGGAPAFLKYLFFPLERLMAKMFYTPTGRSKSLMASYYNKEIVTDAVLEANLAP